MRASPVWMIVALAAPLGADMEFFGSCAGAGIPVYCDDFESGDACPWRDVTGWPNDGDGLESAALDLGTTSDCSDSAIEFAARLDGTADADWARIYVADETCVLLPTLAGSILDGARTCIYFECDSGGDSRVCAAGMVEVTSPDGRPGCCGVGTELFDEVDCSGVDESANFYIRVDLSPDACADFDLSIEF